MKKTLRPIFWFEIGMALISSIVLVLTLVRRDWLEIVFNVDSDNRSGSLEWFIVGALVVVTLTLIILASLEWRRARITAA